MVNSDETPASVCKWADETFGPATLFTSVDRALQECEELCAEFYEDAPDDSRLLSEAADVIICLYRLPGIQEAINKKMTVNRQRKWHKNGDGTGYHIKENSE